jgi:type II secretory pathway pseudopilin PulG
MALARQPLVMTGRMRRALADERGFSLPEILTIVALIGVLFGITIIAFQAAATTIQGDSNLRIVERQLKLARDTAVSQRRSIEVQFVPPNELFVIRRDLPAGTTLLQSAVLENNTTFVRFAGIPDTPDSFGGAGAINLGGAATVLFTSDGMFVDGAGTPVNGTIYVGQIGKSVTQRAVTVFGSTARIRTYRWNGSQWGH